MMRIPFVSPDPGSSLFWGEGRKEEEKRNGG